jgi:hypothetical protein
MEPSLAKTMFLESEIEDTMAKCKGTKRQTTIYKTTPSIRTRTYNTPFVLCKKNHLDV